MASESGVFGVKSSAVLHGGMEMDFSSYKCRLKNLISQLCYTAIYTSRLKAGLCRAKIQICADLCHGLAPAGSLAAPATAPPVGWGSQLEGQK